MFSILEICCCSTDIFVLLLATFLSLEWSSAVLYVSYVRRACTVCLAASLNYTIKWCSIWLTTEVGAMYVSLQFMAICKKMFQLRKL